MVRGRTMTRAFSPEAIPPELVDRLIDLARPAPSAGNSQGWEFLVLEGAEQTGRFWDVTLPVAKRATFRFPQLLDAPVLILPFADKHAYLSRYDEPDKARTRLADEHRWPVPYWLTDTAFAVMTLLLAAEDAGLGTLFFGVFNDAEAVYDAFGVPHGYDLLGVVAMGVPLSEQPEGRSAARPRRQLGDVIHRGTWWDGPRVPGRGTQPAPGTGDRLIES